MSDSNMYADWHVTTDKNDVLTIGLCPSWLCRSFIEPIVNVFEFKTFFIRIVCERFGRLYSVTTWFSITDLLEASNVIYKDLSVQRNVCFSCTTNTF